MKIIKDEEFAALKSAAGNWNSLVSKFTEANPDAKAEEIIPDSLLEAFASEKDENELTSQLVTANAKVTEQAATIASLTATVNELRQKLQAAGDKSKGVKKDVDTEGSASKEATMMDSDMGKRIEAVKALYEILPE